MCFIEKFRSLLSCKPEFDKITLTLESRQILKIVPFKNNDTIACKSVIIVCP